MSYLDLLPEPIAEVVFKMTVRERADPVRVQLLYVMTYWRDALNKEAGQRRRAHDHTPWGVRGRFGGSPVGPGVPEPYTDQLFPFSRSKMSRRKKKHHPPNCVRRSSWDLNAW